MMYYNLFFLTKCTLYILRPSIIEIFTLWRFLIKIYTDRFESIIENNIIKFSDILNNIPAYNILPNSAKNYVDLPFFSNWVIGFTISEGYFTPTESYG